MENKSCKCWGRILLGAAVIMALAGCGAGRESVSLEGISPESISSESISPESISPADISLESAPAKAGSGQGASAEKGSDQGASAENGSGQGTSAENGSGKGLSPEEPPVDFPPETGRLVAIDAGHQKKGNSDKEPIGPGAAESKAKVAGGTKGCVSGLYEYELTLAVSEKLSAELESRGYQVLMVRTSHDVDISNAERAQAANEAGADVFVRIHANGSDNAGVNGVETLCQTRDNPYNADLYEDSRALSAQILDGVVDATGAAKRHVVETDAMSGINWCRVPVTIVEMGFMTNEAEDALMATEEYQQKLAQGIADGIDAYFAAKE